MSEPELTPCVEGSLAEMRQLRELCEAEGIAAELGSEACAKPGCTPKAQLLVRTEDVPRVGNLMRQRFKDSLEREGLAPVQITAPVEGGELACPACGTAAPLKDGACTDCGLQLE